MKVINCEQRSEEWFACRRGIPSASCADQIITMDGKPSKQAEKYMYKLACERVSKRSEESFKSLAMERGIELEAEARNAFEIIKGVSVEQVGFCIYEGDFSVGCSPDGIIKDKDEGLEIKCPISSTIVKYKLDNDALRKEYYQQVQTSLLVSGFQVWYLMGYYPGIHPVILEIEPDKDFQNALKRELSRFCQELDALVIKIG